MNGSRRILIILDINKEFIQTDRSVANLLIDIKGDRTVTKEDFFRQNSSFKPYYTDWAIIRMEMFKRIIGTPDSKIQKPLNLSKNTYNMINQKMIKVYANEEVDIYSKPFTNA